MKNHVRREAGRPSRARNVTLAMLALGSISCGAPDLGEASELGELTADLWLGNSARLWPLGQVQVCFTGTTFSSSQRTAIRAAAESSWSMAADILFWNWGDCPILDPSTTGVVAISSDLTGEAGHSYHCTANSAASCSDGYGMAQTGDYNRIRFSGAAPSTYTVIHEFGHALGFIHENDPLDVCTQRTGGGVSLQNEPDVASVMMSAGCSTPSNLSSWDIMGARKTYGSKPPGSIVGVNNRCFNLAGGSTTFGASIIGWPCSGSTWNQNVIRPSSSLLLRMDNGGSQFCMNVSGGVVGSGLTNLISWNCDSSFTNEQFSFQGVEWRAMGNRCLQAESSASGSKISLQPCTGSTLQKWDFFQNDRRIRLNGTGMCVNVPNNDTTTKTELIIYPCSSGTPYANETFVFDHSYIRYSDKVFNVKSGTVASGNRLILYPASATPNANDQFTLRGQIHVLGQCVDMQDTSGPMGTQLGVRTCGNGASQKWEYWW